jgi:hypothetical protein
MRDFLSYDPLGDRSGLFKVFAETEATKDGILAFANAHGSLGLAIALDLIDGEREGPIDGEQLAAWRASVLEMRAAVELWDAARTSSMEKLSQCLKWTSDTSIAYTGPHLALMISAQGEPGLFATWRPGELIGPALYVVQHRINHALLQHGVVARLLWDSRWAKLSLLMVPRTLIGCMWLQFAKAVDGDKEYRQCENCRAWFEVGGNRTSRSDKRFCTPTCKAAGHRKKQAEARMLYGRGTPLKEIAQRLGTDAKTAKGWVSR